MLLGLEREGLLPYGAAVNSMTPQYNLDRLTYSPDLEILGVKEVLATVQL